MLFNFHPDEERRLYNLVWTASNKYDYEPGFVGLDLNGRPDFYMTLIIGLSYKYFGKDKIDDLFNCWSAAFRRDDLDLLTWIYFEGLAFSMENASRSNLSNLRKEFALNFQSDANFDARRDLARKKNIVYRVYDRRTREILGMDLLKIGDKELELYKVLSDFSVDFDDLKNKLIDAYEKFYPFFYKDKLMDRKRPSLLSSFALISNRQIEYSMRTTSLKDNEETKNILKKFYIDFSSRLGKKKAEEIERIFGKSIFSEERLVEIEKKHCSLGHKNCHLWYSYGDKKQLPSDSFSRDLPNSIERQKNNNIKQFNKYRNQYKKEINSLSKKFSRLLNLVFGEERDHAKSGRLDARLAWKAYLPKEAKIFTKPSIVEKGGFSVDLLLDASASRMNYQTEIAIQAFILATSLYNVDIPVRVISFNTVSDYTSLLYLKNWDEEPELEKIMSYFPMGWNRDGLAYRAYTELLEKKVFKRLTIILTDVSPNDMKVYKDGFIQTSYGGDKALADSKNALLELRKRGINIAGLITGDNALTENARELFGTSFVRVKTAGQISTLAGRFIQRELEKINRKK